MDFLKYQTEAAKTALPQAYDYNYLIPAMVGEVGEVLGQIAKARRDGWQPPRLKAAVVKELGDVTWMIAIALKHAGQPLDRERVRHSHRLVNARVKDADGGDYPEAHGVVLLTVILDHAQSALLFHSLGRVDWMVNELHILWGLLEASAGTLTDGPLTDVLHVNIDKLHSRKERGQLRGSGDDR